MAVIYKDTAKINDSTVEVRVVDDIEWEDIVLHRTKVYLHKRTQEPDDDRETFFNDFYTYRSIKNWLIKDE